MIAMVSLLAVAALALDYARVQVVKTELARAADASARYAVGGLRDGTYLARATWLAARNPVDGSPLALAPADVEYGDWNPATKTFVPGGFAPTAARVTARRTVPLSFMGWFGVSNQQVTARAVAKGNPIGYGVIGLDSLYMTGNGTVSYSSLGTAPTDLGHVASNGNITLGGSALINGKAYAGVGKATTGGTVTGGRETLAAPLSFPNGSAGAYATTNNNGSIPDWAFASPGRSSNSLWLTNGDVLTLPAGHYYLNNVTMSGGSELRFSGPSTLYGYGNFSMTGNTYTAANLPKNLRLVMVPKPDGTPPGTVYVSSSSALYASVYAPQSAVTIAGSADVYGAVLGKTVSVSGSGRIHYDLGLDSTYGTLSLVE